MEQAFLNESKFKGHKENIDRFESQKIKKSLYDK